MIEKKIIMSSSSNSADIVITDEYFILRGGHYVILNGYTRYEKQAKTFAKKKYFKHTIY